MEEKGENLLKSGVLLSTLTSYKIGGPSRYFFDARTEQELADAVREARVKGYDLFIIGGGTNLLARDEGFDGAIVRPLITRMERDGVRIDAGAGMQMSELLRLVADEGLRGLEWAGGLPGTLGGAVRGNAGAFGGEMKDAVKSVKSLDTVMLKGVERTNAECEFGYRSSVFKKLNGREIILSVVLALNEGDKKGIHDAIDEKIAYRKERHPLEYPNAGSVFKNVPFATVPERFHKDFQHVLKTDPFTVVPTAHLITEVGLRGTGFGGAMFSPKHPNFIVNVAHATCSDVETLIRMAKERVKETFSVSLEEEIMRIPKNFGSRSGYR